MAKGLVIILLLFMSMLILTASCQADQFRTDVEMLISELTEKCDWITAPISVGIGYFFYQNSKMSSQFAYSFASEVENAITEQRSFVLVNRSRLGEVLKEMNLQMSDLVNPATMKQIGKIKGLDAIIVGNYTPWGEHSVRVKVELIMIETGRSAVRTQILEGIPPSVRIEPPQYQEQKRRLERIQTWLPQPAQSPAETSTPELRVSIEPDKMTAYEEGEELTLYVKASLDCYIEIYDIASDGAVTQIFPNRFMLAESSDSGNFIRANVRTPIPGRFNFKLQTAKPYGVDTLKVIASTRRFSPRKSSFYSSKSPFPQMGNIDDDTELEHLKSRAKSVVPVQGSSQKALKFAEDYCTILITR